MSDQKKIILTDADGVLVNWSNGFDKFMSNLGHELIPGTDHHYSMSARYDITDAQAYELINEYNRSPCIASLGPYEDSVEYVKKLADDGFKFVCITSLSSDSSAAKYRKKNLEELFGDIFIELICLETGSSKKSALFPWKDSNFFWIEDHIKNAEAGYQLGLKSILIQQGHNGHYDTDHFPIVGPENPWKEIYSMVRKDYGY